MRLKTLLLSKYLLTWSILKLAYVTPCIKLILSISTIGLMDKVVHCSGPFNPSNPKTILKVHRTVETAPKFNGSECGCRKVYFGTI